MKTNVLIVDDDIHVLKALNRTLSQENTVFTSKNSTEAFQILETQDIDLIISDYRLEGELGSDLLQNVYKKWPHITRITITGFKHSDIIEDSINRASVFRFISKPWNNDELLKIVRDAKRRTDILRQNIQTLNSIKRQEKQINSEIKSLKNKLSLVDKDLFNKTEEFEQSKKKLENIYELLENFSSTFNIDDFRKYLLERVTSLIRFDTGEIVEELENINTPLIVNKPFLSKYSFLEANLKSALFYPIKVSVYKKEINWFLVLGRKDILFEHKDILVLEDLISVSKLVLEWRLIFDYVKTGEEQWGNIFNAIKDPIIISDNEAKIIKANDSTRARIGDTDFLQDVKLDKDNYERADYEFKTDNLEERISYFRDLKNEKELYRQLIQSEKLSAIGMLASNIAHELNNPIGGIMAYTQLLKNDKEFEGIKEELTDIEEACKKSKNIVYNLLDFSSDNKRKEKKTVKLLDLVENTLPLLNICLKGYKFSIDIDDNIELNCNIGEIQQILFNLIVNATHATPMQGEITVSGGVNDKFVYFSVADNGSGIPEEIKDKIFDSFFTTKEKTKGTGLGLAVAKSIVEEHGGYIDLESELNKGTKFTIYLPK